MKRILWLCLILTTFAEADAKLIGPFISGSWSYSDTRSFERDLSGNAGDGSVSFSGNKITVSGNSISARNGEVDADATTRGHGLRLAIGYQMRSWFAWELSYNHFADAEWKTNDLTKAINHQYSLDASGIMMLPIGSELSGMARVGVGFVHSNIDFKGNVLGPNNFSLNSAVSEQSLYTITALYSLGLNYDLSRYTSINFEVLHYRGQGNVDDASNYQIALNYYFGE